MVGGRARTWAVLAAGGALLLGGCSAVGDALREAPTDAELLQAVSLTESDAAPDAAFRPLPGGSEVVGRTSLDLCFADFPSEDRRVGRNQVGIGDTTSEAWVSSEAILYRTPQEAETAMAELVTARGECPETPVDPPTPDRVPLAWSFGDAPDADWPDEPGVRRQAYAFTVADDSGTSWAGTATYLQRGRMILALYSTPPAGPATTIRNAPDPARFTAVMAARLAALPEESLIEANPVPELVDPDDIDA
jgi:hypothetical protein